MSPQGRLVLVFEMVAAVTIIPLELGALSKAILQEASQEGLTPDTLRPVGTADQPSAGRLQRPCSACGLADHEADSNYCRRCGAALTG
jgi:ribosomal protein S27AE